MPDLTTHKDLSNLFNGHNLLYVYQADFTDPAVNKVDINNARLRERSAVFMEAKDIIPTVSIIEDGNITLTRKGGMQNEIYTFMVISTAHLTG